MNTEITLAIIAIAATPLGGWIGTILMRQRHRVEIEGLKADLEKRLTETRRTELDNVRQGNDILMQQIVEPLRTEIKSLRSDVNKFRRAIEKIPSCPYSSNCPISRELLADEKGDVVSATGRK